MNDLKDRRDRLGMLVQLLGVLLLGGGCVLEIVYKGGWILVTITIGSIIFAIGTKIKYS